MHTSIRLEAPPDWRAVEAVVESAFGGAAEAKLVAMLRGCPDILSLVAVEGDRIIGHTMFSPVTLSSSDCPLAARALAPVAVAPDAQRRGVGMRMIRFGLAELGRARVDLVFVLGHPAYYPRFGFVPAVPLDFHCKWGGEDGAFQVLELTPGVAAKARGRVEFLPVFDLVDE